MLQRCEIVLSTESAMTCRVSKNLSSWKIKSDRHHGELGQPKGEHAAFDFCWSLLRAYKGKGWWLAPVSLFKMQPTLLNFLLLVSLCLATAAAESQPKKKRDPKLFYVSTTTTTSTWFGSTICFASTTTTLGTCGKRKRRSITDFDPDYTPKIEPSGLR